MLTQELVLLGRHIEPVERVQLHALANGRDQANDLVLEVRGVVDQIEVGVAEPRTRRPFVHDARQLQVLGARPMVLGRVEVLGAIRGRHHVGDLVVAVLAQLERVPAVPLQHRIPAGAVHV